MQTIIKKSTKATHCDAYIYLANNYKQLSSSAFTKSELNFIKNQSEELEREIIVLRN